MSNLCPWNLVIISFIAILYFFQDIVTENATFDLVAFMPHLRERLYSKNTFSRQYIISWVSVLHAVPEIELILFLPDILDGLFNMLSDQNIEIKKMYGNNY